MKLEEIREFISEEFNVYAFSVGNFINEIVVLNLYGVKEPDINKFIKYLKENDIKYSLSESVNKLEKYFKFSENNIQNKKLYVQI